MPVGIALTDARWTPKAREYNGDQASTAEPSEHDAATEQEAHRLKRCKIRLRRCDERFVQKDEHWTEVLSKVFGRQRRWASRATSHTAKPPSTSASASRVLHRVQSAAADSSGDRKHSIASLQSHGRIRWLFRDDAPFPAKARSWNPTPESSDTHVLCAAWFDDNAATDLPG